MLAKSPLSNQFQWQAKSFGRVDHTCIVTNYPCLQILRAPDVIAALKTPEHVYVRHHIQKVGPARLELATKGL